MCSGYNPLVPYLKPPGTGLHRFLSRSLVFIYPSPSSKAHCFVGVSVSICVLHLRVKFDGMYCTFPRSLTPEMSTSI